LVRFLTHSVLSTQHPSVYLAPACNLFTSIRHLFQFHPYRTSALHARNWVS